MTSFFRQFAGDHLGARARRGALWSFMQFGGAQALRFGSNLVLTRLLFPEAFGLMALIQVVLAGLELFSDTGTNTSIVQHARGDEESFLNSAWTIQVIRGGLLWGLTVILAHPIAAMYDQPMLADALPIAGLAILIRGFQPTSAATASRHLTLGKLTAITLGVQAVTIALTVYLAWLLKSEWALVLSSVLAAALTVIAYRVFLPGPANKFHLEREAFWQIFHFGKWIMLATAAGFVVNQGDRAILGFYMSLEALGIYSIGYMLASVPLLLLFALQGKVVIPIYRMKPPMDSSSNQNAIFRARRLLALGALSISVFLAYAGPPLVNLLYDSRYEIAGPIITLYSLSLVPALCLNTIRGALIGLGDSRRAFYITLTTAIFQTIFLFTLIELAGIFGAILAPGLAVLASYPLRVVYALRYKVWDPLQDIWFTLAGLILCGGACFFYWQKIVQLVDII